MHVVVKKCPPKNLFNIIQSIDKNPHTLIIYQILNVLI